MKDRFKAEAKAFCVPCKWDAWQKAETLEQAQIALRPMIDQHMRTAHPKPTVRVVLEVDAGDAPPALMTWAVGKEGTFLGSKYKVVSIE